MKMNEKTVIEATVLLVLMTVKIARAGCYEQKICCPGRNNSCFSYDNGIDHLPKVSTEILNDQPVPDDKGKF